MRILTTSLIKHARKRSRIKFLTTKIVTLLKVSKTFTILGYKPLNGFKWTHNSSQTEGTKFQSLIRDNPKMGAMKDHHSSASVIAQSLTQCKSMLLTWTRMLVLAEVLTLLIKSSIRTAKAGKEVRVRR